MMPNNFDFASMTDDEARVKLDNPDLARALDDIARERGIPFNQVCALLFESGNLVELPN